MLARMNDSDGVSVTSGKANKLAMSTAVCRIIAASLDFFAAWSLNASRERRSRSSFMDLYASFIGQRMVDHDGWNSSMLRRPTVVTSRESSMRDQLPRWVNGRSMIKANRCTSSSSTVHSTVCAQRVDSYLSRGGRS